MKRRTKIVATIGPSSDSREMLAALIEAGIDVARLNFSHGTHESHLKQIELIREFSDKYDKPISILQDLQGPKLRVGTLPEEGVPLQAGEILNMEIDLDNRSMDFIDGEIKTIFMEIPNILHSLKAGRKILLDDGKLEMEVLEVYDRGFKARVILGGRLYSHKGVNLPGTELDIPGFTEKDQEDLTFGLDNGIDAVAISFVRSADDITCIREFIGRYKPEKRNITIIAKLELPQAVTNLLSILDVADGVMVARGDLGVETSPADVPVIQKEIIQAANQKTKLVITATQMLDSMIENPRPTRAEASDVANAIFDGTDAVMLSGESASGKYPLESVLMMDKIACEAEKHMSEWGHAYQPAIGKDQDDSFTIAIAARELAHDREVTCIAVFTQSGRSALLQSKARPQVPILAFTPIEDTYRRLGMNWGVIPHLVPFSNSLEEMIQHVEDALLASTSLKRGQKVVFISGFPIGAMRSTNLALLHTIGSLKNP
ncbi:pyruvate kinase [Pelolinea submarina]|uniref:Pyruvate kinase n=1 Tax=Pelolinea submarina TaxID=913107 RepID=A0A3E0AGR7_9CHLR|nr:pyruvate kinase [Pelolinea submarina]REG10841.1 pyruvate kinase [Pelolinea submarina]